MQVSARVSDQYCFTKKYTMKPIHLILTLIIAFSASLYAEDSKDLPDFTKAFPQEKLFQQTKISKIETYVYATNVPFVDLKEQFTKFLGKGWMLPEVDPETKKATNEAMKKQGMTFEGNVLFSHQDYPGIKVALTQMKMELEGKKFIVNITVLGKK